MSTKPIFNEMERTNRKTRLKMPAIASTNSAPWAACSKPAVPPTRPTATSASSSNQPPPCLVPLSRRTFPAGTLPSTATRPTSNTSRLSTLPSARRRRPTSPSRNLSPKAATNPSRSLSLNPKAETAKLKAATLTFHPRKYILNESRADSVSRVT